MGRFILGGFVVAHGLLTVTLWAMPAKEGEPFRVTHSWLLGDARSLALGLALLAGACFVVAGGGFLGHQSWWGAFGIAGGAMGLLLMALYFNPWLLAGIGISAGVLYAGVQALQA